MLLAENSKTGLSFYPVFDFIIGKLKCFKLKYYFSSNNYGTHGKILISDKHVVVLKSIFTPPAVRW